MRRPNSSADRLEVNSRPWSDPVQGPLTIVMDGERVLVDFHAAQASHPGSRPSSMMEMIIGGDSSTGVSRRMNTIPPSWPILPCCTQAAGRTTRPLRSTWAGDTSHAPGPAGWEHQVDSAWRMMPSTVQD